MMHSIHGRGISRLIVLIGLLFGTARASLAYPDPGRSEAAPSLTGVLSIIWGDALDGTSSVDYYLTTDEGHRRELTLSPGTAPGGLWRLNGQRVTVYPIGGRAREVSLAGPLPVTRIDSVGRVTDQDPLIGELPYLSLLCAFPDGDGKFNPIPFYRDMYGGDEPRLGHYWDELSYGAISMAGSDAAGPFPMPHPYADYGIPDNEDLERLFMDCVAAADPTVDFSAFYGVNLMFNVTGEVWGVAWGGGLINVEDGDEHSVTATFLPTWAWGDASVVAHEMGHTFGLGHSSGPYGYTYDSPWDVMSNDRYPCYAHGQHDDTYGCIAQHTIGIHKTQLGWIEDNEIYTAGIGNHSIEIDALTAPESARPRLIKVPVSFTENFYYTLEARQMVGYDEGILGTGIVIHEYHSRWDPILIDGDSNGDTYDHGTLWDVGEVFHIADDGITINVTQKTANGYKVDIQVTAPPPFTTCAAQKWVAVEECKALVALYEQTNGSEWYNNNGWLIDSNPCRWYGVGCERIDDTEWPRYTVNYLIPYGNKLRGSIPARLGDLRSLRGIDFTGNRLSGNLPKELGRLTHLEFLAIGGDNRLTGGIPPELGQLTGLRSLALWTNSWQDGLSGPIPEEFSGLGQLEFIDLTGQKLTGPVPEFLGRLENLSYLRLSNNQFSGILPSSLGDLSNLDHLIIDNNPLVGGIPNSFTRLEKLSYFEFENTGLCQPPNAVFQAWLNNVTNLAPEDILCDTSLAGNYGDGAPGSRFALRGVVFPPNTPATVTVNGRRIGQVQTDEFGEVTFLLDTTEADEGVFAVTVEAGKRAAFTIRLYNGWPQRTGRGEESLLAIPPGTAALAELFVPVVARP